MSLLPDELWRLILELGVQTSSLTYKDICCLSMASRRLNLLSKEDNIWSKLLSSDFPTHSSSSTTTPPKSAYQIRFEKDKAKKLLAEKRPVLRLESQIHEHTRQVKEIEVQLVEENEKIKSAIDELKNLQKVREASSVLKVWQPEVVHGRHRQIVEHCSVPVESRINVVEMEIKLCRQQICGFLKARRDENGRLEAVKEKFFFFEPPFEARVSDPLCEPTNLGATTLRVARSYSVANLRGHKAAGRASLGSNSGPIMESFVLASWAPPCGSVKEKLSKVKYRSFESLEGGSTSNVDDESRKCRKKSKKLKRVE